MDDTPLVPGDDRAPYEHGSQARQVLNDAEDDLRDWRPDTDGLNTPVGHDTPDESVKGKERAVDEDGDVMSPSTERDRNTTSDGQGGEGAFHDDRSSQADA